MSRDNLDDVIERFLNELAVMRGLQLETTQMTFTGADLKMIIYLLGELKARRAS